MADTMTRTGQQVGATVAGAAEKAGFRRPDQAPEHHRHAEGPVAATIEEYTAQIPSDVFLWAAGASILGSLSFKMAGRQHTALFVGQWVAPFLILGLYNKLVKVAGTDRTGANNGPAR